jgi:hypothetical protein
MKQVARSFIGLDGFLAGCGYLIHDRSSLFTPEFAMILESVGIETVRLPFAARRASRVIQANDLLSGRR